MSEKPEKRDPFDLNAAQRKLAETLKGIGVDLWGTGDPDKWAEMAFEQSAAPARPEDAPAADAGQPQSGGKPAPKAPVPPKRKVTVENVWKNADETVDWTEALVRETPADGLTAPSRWGFYHRMARPVLEGDLKAYAEVLTTLNPLGDLTELVNGMVLRTPAADRLECEFECRPDRMEQDSRLYLGGLSLRIARDLLAVLPVEEVRILGRLEGTEKVCVTFRRGQLLKKKMAFVDPADLLTECGGTISG
ncbi:MAG: hypothetical protein IKE25_07310 [Clostridia bacterium]|nr:hypothetical protein [Clostridia bacterium]